MKTTETNETHKHNDGELIRCTRCGRTLPRQAFYTRPSQQKPYIADCKECHKKQVRQQYRKRHNLQNGEVKEYCFERNGRIYHRKGKRYAAIITEQQIATVRLLYPRHENCEVCQNANISLYTLFKIVKRLGISKDYEYLTAQREYRLRKAEIDLVQKPHYHNNDNKTEKTAMQKMPENTKCAECAHSYETINYRRYCPMRKRQVLDNDKECEMFHPDRRA